MDFNGSAEQCFLIGYRALCHEVYQKTGMVRSYPRLRELVDRGLPPEHQRSLQAFWAQHNAGAERGLKDFQLLKTQMDEQLLRRDYHGWTRALIRLSGELCIASTGAVSVNRDLEGNALQVLHDPDSEMQELLFGVVATSDGGAAVFTWRTGDLGPPRFVESLLAKEQKRLPHLLVQFVFAYIENTYFSDRWWGTLSENDRKQVEALACMGDPYYTDFSYSSSLHLVPWVVTEVVVSV